jgi:hypothetical protein
MLDIMLKKKVILQFYKDGLVNKGYTYKDLIWINSQLILINELVNKEAWNCLNELLRKTNYRLLKCIHQGNKNIPSIITNSYDWQLAKIEGNELEWLNKEALIFETETCTLVFSKNQLHNEHKYINNKWQ